MLYAAGIILLGLGLFCGAVLVLAPLGILGADAGLTLWILFPAFSVAGYLVAASSGRNESLPLLSRVTGVLHLVLALFAAVALVLHGASILEARDGTLAFWYVLGIGFVLGASGLAAHRPRGQPAP